MYFKLAFRNAKRSMTDYLLYIFSLVILLTIMSVSNYISILSNVSFGFQTMSLPLLIILILIVLVRYANEFMLMQRTKEFANYLLMGMEKNYLIKMFVTEFIGIGLFCFLISNLLCYAVCSMTTNLISTDMSADVFIQSILYGVFYFIIIEALSVGLIIHRIKNLQICELMKEKKSNQIVMTKNSSRLWGFLFWSSFICFIFMLWMIVYLSEEVAFTLISFISIPILLTIFSFYNWLFQLLISKRKKWSEWMYKKDFLYLIGKITSVSKTNIIINAVFCCCLLFSAMAFVFGVLMFTENQLLSDRDIQNWMGILQILICIIFIVLFFSILSLREIINTQHNEQKIKLLYYLGKDKQQLKTLIKKQILINLFVPALMALIILIVSAPFINHKLNLLLSNGSKNIYLYAISIYTCCFLVLYFCYYIIVYIINTKNLKGDLLT